MAPSSAGATRSHIIRRPRLILWSRLLGRSPKSSPAPAERPAYRGQALIRTVGRTCRRMGLRGRSPRYPVTLSMGAGYGQTERSTAGAGTSLAFRDRSPPCRPAPDTHVGLRPAGGSCIASGTQRICRRPTRDSLPATTIRLASTPAQYGRMVPYSAGTRSRRPRLPGRSPRSPPASTIPAEYERTVLSSAGASDPIRRRRSRSSRRIRLQRRLPKSLPALRLSVGCGRMVLSFAGMSTDVNLLLRGRSPRYPAILRVGAGYGQMVLSSAGETATTGRPLHLRGRSPRCPSGRVRAECVPKGRWSAGVAFQWCWRRVRTAGVVPVRARTPGFTNLR